MLCGQFTKGGGLLCSLQRVSCSVRVDLSCKAKLELKLSVRVFNQCVSSAAPALQSLMRCSTSITPSSFVAQQALGTRLAFKKGIGRLVQTNQTICKGAGGVSRRVQASDQLARGVMGLDTTYREGQCTGVSRKTAVGVIHFQVSRRCIVRPPLSS